ncbi:hypothetical protein KFE25_001836 [Diacronema lutheri]|uniref:CWH43-like N-terminal domain-containing protein n=1 Tax=Diacronema lutheri TaxID=2081491 RepID=A0A8J5XFH0_DIALT|nr:hypothetical protein KFE25_001836 [Diacronema lutheri]
MLTDRPPIELLRPHVFRGDAVLAVFLAFGTVTFAVTYALSWTVDTRRLTSPYLFLSETIDYAPSSCVGSFLLSPACALMALVVLLRKEQLAYVSPPLRLWWLGPVGALGGHGVASFQVHNAPLVHFTFAGVFFGALTLYVMASVRHERAHAVPVRSELCATIRFVSAILAPLLVLAAAAVAPFIAAAVAAGEQVDLDDSSDAAAGPRIARYIALLATIEITVYLNFAAHFASLHPELRALQISFKVTRLGAMPPVGDGSLDEPFINFVAAQA